MNNNQILFSIIVPIYNCDKYLRKLIESILNQGYKNFELILVNDGSIDKSIEICNEFSKNNSNIIVIDKENTGVSDTRNIGLKIAKGKYILFLDADDYIDEGYLEYVVDILEKYNYNIDWINTGIYTEIENNTGIYREEMTYKDIFYRNRSEFKNDLINLWDAHMLDNPVNKIYVKKIVDDNNLKFANLDFGEDLDFNMRYSKYISNMYNSKKCFYHYIRERKGAATEKYKNNLFELREKEYLKFNNYFEENKINFEDYIEFSSRRFIERVVGCTENICKGSFTSKEKKKEIKKVVENNNVRFALKYVKPKSKKMKILIFPLKMKLTNMMYLFSKCTYCIKKLNPTLFYKLKGKR